MTSGRNVEGYHTPVMSGANSEKPQVFGGSEIDRLKSTFHTFEHGACTEPRLGERLSLIKGSLEWQILETRGRIAGVTCVITKDGVRKWAFIARDPDDETALKLFHLIEDAYYDHKLGNLDIINGRIVGAIQIEKGDVPELSEPPAPFTVPKNWKDREVQTLASHNDSWGKTRWRRLLQNAAWKVFPEGREGLDIERPMVVCMAGRGGKEIEDVWRPLGFKDENILILELDKSNVNDLRARYPKSPIIPFKFQYRSSSSKIPPYPTVTRLLRAIHDKIVAVSLDPEGRLNKHYVNALAALLNNDEFEDQINDKLFVAVNFSTGRREPFKLYKELTGKSKAGMPRDQLRMEAIRSVVPAAISREVHGKSSQPFTVTRVLESGLYAGDSKTRMLYAMQELSRNKQ